MKAERLVVCDLQTLAKTSLWFSSVWLDLVTCYGFHLVGGLPTATATPVQKWLPATKQQGHLQFNKSVILSLPLHVYMAKDRFSKVSRGRNT